MISGNSILSNKQTEKYNRRLEILDAYKVLGYGATDRAIMHYLGFKDKNKVSPRISELIEEGFLMVFDKGKCLETGRTVRIVKLARKTIKTKKEEI